MQFVVSDRHQSNDLSAQFQFELFSNSTEVKCIRQKSNYFDREATRNVLP